MTGTADVVVAGGGPIGLGIAWRAARAGLRVTVADPAPGTGASRAAAGMLAPLGELHFGEQPLLRLNLASAARYPDWVAELEEATGHDVGYRRHGSVSAAWDATDLAELRRLHEFQGACGVAGRMLTGRELRELEPALTPGLPGGLLAGDDHQVDPRALHAALLAAAANAGAGVIRQRVVRLRTGPAGVTGAVLADGSVVSAGTVVLAAGAWSRDVAGVPPEVLPPVRPVKGQTLLLRAPHAAPLHRVVRGTVRGAPVYLVPRDHGRVVVGASSEEAGFDVRPRAGAVYELLRDALALVPELGELELEEVSTGLRPGSPDNAPIVGPTALPGLWAATGHYRNGVLLTPVTADGVAAALAGQGWPEVLRPFSPARFTDSPDTRPDHSQEAS